MPTGYTADVGDGKVTDFTQFAMRCARAFGALVTLRDDPSDAPIPEAFAPSSYNENRLVEARAELARLKAMTTDQRDAAAIAAHVEAAASWDRYVQSKADTRQRYEAMLTSVRAWQPPTPDHAEMKSFMEKQLLDSIDFDCGPAYGKRPEPKKREDWFSEAVAKANKDIAYHGAEHAKEVERTRSRTEWVRALRASLVKQKV